MGTRKIKMSPVDYISVYKELKRKDAMPSKEILARIFGALYGQIGMKEFEIGRDEIEFYSKKNLLEPLESELELRFKGHVVFKHEKYFFTIEDSLFGGTEVISWESEDHRVKYGLC